MDRKDFVDTLGRIPGEGRKAYRALIDYALMDSRSLRKLLAIYEELDDAPTRRLTSLKSWSGRYDWQRRVAAFDVAVYEARVNEWNERRVQLRERDWNEGTWLRNMAVKVIETEPKTIATLTQAGQLLSMLSSLQRQGVQEPAQIVALTGAALDKLIERELERAANPG